MDTLDRFYWGSRLHSVENLRVNAVMQNIDNTYVRLISHLRPLLRTAELK